MGFHGQVVQKLAGEADSRQRHPSSRAGQQRIIKSAAISNPVSIFIKGNSWHDHQPFFSICLLFSCRFKNSIGPWFQFLSTFYKIEFHL